MARLTVHDLGRAAYEPTLRLQEKLLAEVQAAGGDAAGDGHLVTVEHDPPAITLGRGADAANVLASRERLDAMGVDLVETSRGGDVTYHGPGQLVGYPILKLPPAKRPVREYVEKLEEALIRSLAAFGIETGRRDGMIGVWAGDEKVAAIGVGVSHWCAYHGFALNVATELSHFDLIVPCGIREKRVTSMSELAGREIAVEEVKPVALAHLADVLGFDAVDYA